MKKILIIAFCTLLATASLFAQGKKKTNTVDITVKANNNEVFNVYLDGKQKSDKASSKYEIKGLQPNKMYDLEVYLEEPIKYISGVDLELSAGRYELIVFCDPATKSAEILFANDGKDLNDSENNAQLCTEDDMTKIMEMFKIELFDDTRLHFVKTTLKGGKLVNMEQTRRIATAFSYDKARVKFLKYAYDYCTENENYSVLESLLTDSSAKEEFNKFLQSK
ncbi:MAG: DUF4476 domain-containing protein [Bacteroidales bacterium]|nr:DUF4476 domain-containing protein [Bacteroidales bacterium]